MFTITTARQSPQTACLSASGDLDIFAAVRLRRELSALSDEGGVVHVDLAAIGFVDVSALGVLSRSWRSIERFRAEVHLVRASESFEVMCRRAHLWSTFYDVRRYTEVVARPLLA